MTRMSRSVSVEVRARSRLIHDDDAGIEGKGFGNLQQLTLSKRKAGHEIVDFEVDVQTLQERVDNAARSRCDRPA